MKQINHIAIYLLGLLALVGCSEQIDLDDATLRQSAEMEGKPVTVEFTVNMPYAETTRSSKMCEAPIGDDRIETLYAIVFDENGLFLESVECQHGSVEDPKDPPYTPEEETGYYKTPFHVVLHASSKPRAVHLVANYVPQNLSVNGESAIFDNMEVSNSTGAYWQRVYLDKGIKLSETDETLASDETLDYFRNIPLVRNFLKVNIANSATEHFTLTGYYVFHRPSNGTVAAYNPNATIDSSDPLSNSFAVYYNMDEYKTPSTKSYSDLAEVQQYWGNEPDEIYYIDDPDYLQDGSTDAAFPFESPDDPIFMYERNISKTTKSPSFIIFKGIYGEDTEETYYKADFVYPDTIEEGEVATATNTYYHLLRNFNYTLKISKVESSGRKTIYDAVNGQAMNNFSVTSETKELTNIGSENARLFVTFTDELFTATEAGTKITLGYKHLSYTKDGSTGSVDNKVKGKDATDSDTAYVAITGTTNGKVLDDNYPYTLTDSYTSGIITDDTDGYRYLTLTLGEPPTSGILKQTITITSSTGLTREVTLEYSRPLTLSATKTVSSDDVEVDFTIPAGLSERRFPLEFKIASSTKNIYPDVTHADFEEMPVSVGSIDDESGTTTYGDFYYTRTITYEEYKAAANKNGSKTFACYFKKTDTSASEGTIYVKGGSYFANVKVEAE